MTTLTDKRKVGKFNWVAPQTEPETEPVHPEVDYYDSQEFIDAFHEAVLNGGPVKPYDEVMIGLKENAGLVEEMLKDLI